MAGKKTKEELNALLNSVIQRLRENIEVDEILLFGSYAKGTEKDESDIDVAVISPELDTRNPIFENTLAVHRKSNIYEPYLQLLAFPSETFYEEKFIDPGFIQEIKRTGKSIYKKQKLLGSGL